MHASGAFIPNNFPIALAQLSVDSLPFVLVQYLHIFRMPSFFLVAGFVGRLLLHRRGTAGFIRNRRDRILIPLILSWLLFIPMMTYVRIWKRTVENAMAARTPQISPWHATLSAFTTGEVFHDGIPLEHLWFLYELIFIYVLVLCLRWMCGRWAAAGRIGDLAFRALIESWLGAIVIAAPLTVALYRTQQYMDYRGLPILGVARLAVDKPILLAYGTFFLIGWFLCRQPDLLGIIERRALLSTAVGIVAGAWPLVLIAHTANRTGIQPTAIEKLSYGAAYGLAMVLMSFGFVGIFLRWLSEHNKVVRYLSDSAYWIYLAHLPLVRALQVALYPWSVHWSIKIGLITLSSLAMLLFSYQFLVRYSWIGVMLSGPRTAPKTLKARDYAEATV